MDTTPQKSTESGPVFDARAASSLMRVAVLPEIFEETLLKPDKRPEEDRRRDAVDAVITNAPAGIARENIFILQRENVTAIVVYDPKANTATVTFDPTHPGGGLFNPDNTDNLARSPVKQGLGGEVHGGLLKKLTDEPENAPSLIQHLEGILHDLSGRQGTPLTVNFTGFSKGGAQAMLAAGELIAGNLFDNNPNIKLGNLYAVAPLAYGNATFVANFNSKVEALGGTAWTVEIQGDKTPTILTPNADSFFTRHNYSHIGNHAYVIPATPQNNSTVIINPDPASLQKLRAEAPKDVERHNTSVAMTALDRISPQTATQEPVQIPALLPVTKP